MGWNEPNNGNQSGKNQPPDLDEALKNIQNKLKNFFYKGSNTSSDGSSSSGNGGGLLVAMIAGVTLILWALSGIFIVDPAEQAAIMRFGKYVETVGPGPHWILRGVYSKVVLNVDKVADYSYSAQMLTKDENLVSVAVAVQYKIGDLEDYLFNVSDPEESLKQATSSALRQVVGQTTLDKIITEGREAWGISVQDSLVKILDSYKTGIVIVNVSPQPARAPENVQDAFDDAIKAQEDEKRFKEQARAYEASVVPIAQGNAKRIFEEAKAFSEQVVLKATGETSEFLELLPQYVKAPAVTAERLYLEAMQQVLTSSSKIIVDAKAGNLMYLPLDKLTSIVSAQPKDERSKASKPESMQSTTNLGTYFDGRDLVRPLERSGRE